MNDQRPHWSASQISTFRDCPRKWAYDKIDKVPRQSNIYAALGSFIHGELEKYLQTGALPGGDKVVLELLDRAGKLQQYTGDEILAIMLPGLPHLPEPGVAETEKKFEIDLGELGYIIGYIDFIFNDGDGGPPVIGDHKTTGDLRYAQTKTSLLTDEQSTIYTVFGMKYFDVDELICRWVYYRTKKPKSIKPEIVRTVADVEGPWNAILDTIKEMKHIKDTCGSAAMVPYDVSACSKYGGCAYKGVHCKLTSAERMRSMFKMASLKDRMAARRNGGATPTPEPATEATQPTPEPVVVEALKKSLLSRVRGSATSAPETSAGAVEGAGTDINPPEKAKPLTALQRMQAKRAKGKSLVEERAATGESAVVETSLGGKTLPAAERKAPETKSITIVTMMVVPTDSPEVLNALEVLKRHGIL